MGLTGKGKANKPGTTTKANTSTTRPQAAPKQTAAPKQSAPPKPSNVPARPNYIPQTSSVPDMPMDDLRQPAINIVQMISPELVPGDPKQIQGAVAGQLFNTSTRQLFDGGVGVELVPLQYRKYYTEWTPRAQGGGFVAQYETKEEMEQKADPKNEVRPTYEFACWMPETDGMVCVQFNTPSKYGVARAWAAMIQEVGTMYGRKYRITTKLQTNKQKQPYYIFVIQPTDWVTQEQFTMLDELAKSMQAPQLTDGGSEPGEM